MKPINISLIDRRCRYLAVLIGIWYSGDRCQVKIVSPGKTDVEVEGRKGLQRGEYGASDMVGERVRQPTGRCSVMIGLM